MNLIERLKDAEPQIDWTLFEQLQASFEEFLKMAAEIQPSANAYKNSLVVAFDLWDGVVNAKAYIHPAKCYGLGLDVWQLVSQALEKLKSLDIRIMTPYIS